MAIIDKININSIDYDIAVKGENVSGSVPAARTLDGLTATIDELNYSSGLTGNVQGQLDKLNNAIVETDKNVLENSKEATLELISIKGNTYQKSYSGKNLVPAADKDSSTACGITSSVKDEIVTASGTATEAAGGYNSDITILYKNNVQLKDNTTYTVSIQDCTGTMPTGAVSVFLMDAASNTFPKYTAFPITAKGRVDITTGFLCGALLVRIPVGETINGTFRIQIEEGTEATSWEPYVGGATSPNPAYPQSIINTSDCVEMIQGAFSMADGSYVPSDNMIITKERILCKGFDIINLYIEGSTETYFMFFDKNGNAVTSATFNTHNITNQAPKEADSFIFETRATLNAVGKISLTVNGKYVNTIKLINKNLFDNNRLLYAKEWSKTDGWYRGGTWLLYQSNKNIFGDIQYKENTQYTVKVTTKGITTYTELALEIAYTDGTDEYKLISNYDLTECSTTVITQNGKSVKNIEITYTDDNLVLIKDFLIQEGAIENPIYEPYKEILIYFFTEEPLRDGDIVYQDTDGLFKVKHTMFEYKANGTEAWTTYNGQFYLIRTNFEPIAKASGICISDYFSNTKLGNDWGITIPYSPFSTLDEWKTWVTENQPVFQYELETPTIEILDDESQKAFNSLKSFNDVTYIDFDSRVKPEAIVVRYATTDLSAKAFDNTRKIEKLNEKVKFVKNDIVTTTDTILNDSKDGGYKVIEIAGNTEQKTYTGKNLHNAYDLVGGYKPKTSDDYVVINYDNTSGTGNAYPNVWTVAQPLLKENTEYTIIVELTKLTKGLNLHVVDATEGQFNYDPKWVVSEVGTHINKCTTKSSFVGIANCLQVYMPVPAGEIGEATFRISILEDTTVTADNFKYEPYVGGMASPNPSYPQPLLSTGDIALSQGYWDVGLVYDTKHVRSESVYSCKTGDNVKIIYGSIATAMGFVFYDSNMNMLGIAHDSSGYVREFSAIAPTNTSYFGVNVRVSDEVDTTPQTAGKITVTINGKYVNHIKTHSKNLFNINYFIDNNYYSINGESLIVNKDDFRQYDAIKTFYLKPNTVYTLSVQNACKLYYGHDYAGGISSSDKTNALSFKTSKTGIAHFKFLSFDGYPFNVGHVQLEEGAVATDYVPYCESSAYFLTNEPMIKGSTLFKENGLFKVEHTYKKLAFNGTETGWKWYRAAGGLAFYRPGDAKPYAKTLCNIYVTYLYDGYKYGVGVDGSKDICVKDDDHFTDLNTFKTYISNNPLEVEYELETPIIEVLDNTSQIALNGLETFDEITYVDFDSRVQPEHIKAKYGTTDSAAIALKCSLDNDTKDIQLQQLTAATLALSQM